MLKQPRKSFKYIFQSLLCLFLAAITANPASAALSDTLLDEFNINGIYYYNPQGISSCVVGVGSYSGETSAGLTSTQAGFVDGYHNIAEQLSVEYGIPWETVMAQGILESAAGTSSFAIKRNNFFGIGAFDSNPNNAHSFATPMDGWRGYYENIRKTSTYRNHGVFSGATITDPYAYAQAIKDAGYATDPNYVAKVSRLISAIENRAAEKGWSSSAQLASAHPEMLENAAKNAAGGHGSATIIGGSVSYTSSVCIPPVGSGGGNGDINQTALELAWPDYGAHSLRDPNPNYLAALRAVGLTSYGEQWVEIGASCDAFVAAVMRYSGLDPNFFCCGIRYNQSGGVHAYLKNHPELYQYVGSGNNSSNAQPGDIRIRQGHIELIVQKPDGSLAIASASHAHRTAEVSNGWFAESGYTYELYRFVGSRSS